MTFHRQVGLGLSVLLLLGCGSEATKEVEPTATKVRAERRAYHGAPPAIPHARLGGACITCHTAEGNQVIPKVGIAPANPHLRTPGLSADARCEQCHVFQQTDEVFTENEFAPFLLASSENEPAHPYAPPVIPHPLFMREDCNACHSGAAARPEIRCQHAERKRCQQCHVPRKSSEEFPVAEMLDNRPDPEKP